MKILHISSADLAGGAAKSAYRLHMSLMDRGIDSTMWVWRKQSPDSSVLRFEPPQGSIKALEREVRKWRLHLEDRVVKAQWKQGKEIFSNVRTKYGRQVAEALPPTDIINLHWITGFVDITRFLSSVQQPVVWTLHDMNAFTGGCHFDNGCGRFTEDCGNCPQLDSVKGRDLSRANFKRKQESYCKTDAARFYVVTPSEWLADQARRSSLLGKFDIRTIPYGVDTDIFAPRNADCLRMLFEIPSTHKVAIFVADQPANPRKGFESITRALLCGDFEDLTIVVVGKAAKFAKYRHRQLYCIGSIEDERLLSMLYSLADVFVVASTQDNLPNTVIEAMACGTPVIGTRAGGIPELVVEGETGYLADPGDVTSLRAAVVSLLGNDTKRAEMSKASRLRCERHFQNSIQAESYRCLYEDILS